MIDLKSLAEYGRRSGALLPPQLFLLDAPHDAGQEAASLIGAWLDCWDEIEPETRSILAEHLGLSDAQALYEELVAQGVSFLLAWVKAHGELPSKFEALRRAVGEEV